MIEFDYWKFLAGLGIFLFGMQLLENAIKEISGKAFRRFVRDYTSTRIKAIANGVVVTALLQSSSAVSLMVLAFVGAGIMSLENAIGVILGSNIGTTLTAWIVATLGFKIKIETFALPFLGIAAAGIVLFKPGTRLHHLNRLLIGFGFLFLGLDYMKTSVEGFSQHFDPQQFANLSLWMYLMIGTVMTALMQASAATLAIALTALNSQLMTFDMAAAMVIGANVGTTITVLIGAIGGTPPKKIVATSHLIFNLVTGIVAFAALPVLVTLVTYFIDISESGPMGLALFHTLFNLAGVMIFLPLVSLKAKWLVKLFPERKTELTVYIANTPIEETDAAIVALKNEIIHLLHESQLYTMKILQIDRELVFDDPLPFERNRKKSFSTESLYNDIKRLHSSIIAYYSRIQSEKLDEATTHELEKMILASRNIINAAKNFKGIQSDLDEFDASDAGFLNRQYSRFKKRLISLYHSMNTLQISSDMDAQYDAIVKAFKQVELLDDDFIQTTVETSCMDEKMEDALSTLFLVNRLFTQACRMLIFSWKDMTLSQEKSERFDREIER